ncbi:MAG: hypothetical protein E6F99_22935 [Actinobacteria bacterium]|nr:MAG: hypothetical protein E6F99_22935 [Actinomycetota bacterium]
MQINDNSGEGGTTDWSTKTVAQMWQMIADHRQDIGYVQAAAWDRTRELVDHHMSRLRAYREDLANTWNPATSPAAAAYFAKVDELIDSMTTVCDTSASTGAGLSHVNASLAEARIALEPLHQQWAANQSKMDAYDRAVQSGHDDGTVQAGWGGPAFRIQQQQLHQQAQTIMSKLGSQTLEGVRAMTPPPEYQPPQLIDPPSSWRVPSPSSSGSGGGDSSASHTFSAPSTPSGGPVLSVAPSAPPGRPLPPPSGSPGPPGGPTPVPLLVPRPVEHPPVGRIIGPPGPGIGDPVDPTARRVPNSESPFGGPRRALPPGGVIGGTPFDGVEPERLPAAGGLRATAPGGVIGPTTGRETEGMFAPGVAGDGRTGDQRRGHRNHAYDSDEYWPVHRGVRPVIEPGPEPVHDPGPILGPHP